MWLCVVGGWSFLRCFLQKAPSAFVQVLLETGCSGFMWLSFFLQPWRFLWMCTRNKVLCWTQLTSFFEKSNTLCFTKEVFTRIHKRRGSFQRSGNPYFNFHHKLFSDCAKWTCHPLLIHSHHHPSAETSGRPLSRLCSWRFLLQSAATQQLLVKRFCVVK